MRVICNKTSIFYVGSNFVTLSMVLPVAVVVVFIVAAQCCQAAQTNSIREENLRSCIHPYLGKFKEIRTQVTYDLVLLNVLQDTSLWKTCLLTSLTVDKKVILQNWKDRAKMSFNLSCLKVSLPLSACNIFHNLLHFCVPCCVESLATSTIS